MRLVALPVVILLGLAGAPAAADDVYLHNGNAFEGVLAEEGADSVRIRLAYGELSLPRSLVLRVEKGDSALQRYLERRAALRRSGAGAAEWLELARWADAEGLEHGHREAALAAAERSPHLVGLDEHMRRLDYVLDPDVERWLPRRESRRAAPPEAAGGRSMHPGPRPARVPAERRSELEERLSRTIELLALAQLERESRPAPVPVPVAASPFYPVPFYPVVVLSGWVLPEPPGPAPPGSREGLIIRRPSNRTALELVQRQPGSIVPLSSGHPSRTP